MLEADEAKSDNIVGGEKRGIIDSEASDLRRTNCANLRSWEGWRARRGGVAVCKMVSSGGKSKGVEEGDERTRVKLC